MPQFNIIRTGPNRFHVSSNIVMADGSRKSDTCALIGNVLAHDSSTRIMMIDGGIRLTLGARSLPQVLALQLGESVMLGSV
jgi:hypothetical protein